jgi:HEAT repeat protein
MKVPHTLASNARTDSNSWVRLRNLRCLVDSFPKSEEKSQAIKAALGDPDAGVRLFAATHARREHALAPLRELLETEANPAEVRLAALEHLLAEFRYEQFAPSVAVALGAVDEQVRIAAVRAVGAKRDLTMLERVCAMIAGSRERLAWSIAKTLGELGDPKAEPTLRKLLSYDSKEVKAAAEHALGQVDAVQKNQDG